jgi:hypothetical protein
MNKMPGLSDEDGKTLIADTLRLFVGHGRRLSWADLAAATGDDERKLRSYVERDPAAMPAPVMMRVFAVLPPEAFGRVAARMGFSTGPLELDDLQGVRNALTETSRLVTQGNEYFEDGELDHVERAQLAEAARNLMPKLAALAGLSGGRPN